WTRTCTPAPMRASRRCPTRPGRTAPARWNRPVPASTASKRAIASTSPASATRRAGPGPNPSAPAARPHQRTRPPTPRPSRPAARPRVVRAGRRARRPYCTAYRALFHRAQARPGEIVLIHGATGGVGIAAVELAHARGLIVIGSGGTDKGLAAVKAHGADVVV